MRIRFRFAKLGKIRFTSQRDVARMCERALRRASLPLAYTEGFSPRPQLSFGLALPTGAESLAEHGLPDCRWTPCYDCGACTGYGVEHVVASAVPPAGGSQGTGQDLSTGGQVPVRFLSTAPSGAAPAPVPGGSAVALATEGRS